jgi:hypothetical protein
MKFIIFHRRSLISVFLLTFSVTIFLIVGLLIASTPVIAEDLQIERFQATQVPDIYEPNDTQTDAKTFVTASPVTSLTFSVSGTNSPNDVDFYLVGIDNNRVVTYNAILESSGTALRISGFEVDGVTAVGSTPFFGTTSNVVITNTSGSFKQYKLKVENQFPTTPGRYRVEFTVIAISAPTAVPGSAAPDAYENNNSPADVLAQNPIRSFLNVGSTFSSSALPNFFSTAPIGSIRENGDVDWFFIYAARSREHGGSAGRYRVTTSVQPGVDTEIGIFREDQLPPDNVSAQGLIAANDDYKDFDRGSQIEFTAPYEGRYWIKIWNKDPSPRTGSSGYNPSYNIAIVEIGASATTTVPTSTPFPQGIDRFEFNGDIERATLIAPNVKYDNLNFVPFQPPTTGTIDNDFFRMPVKQGVFYTCETLDLAGGTDTNLIVYNQNATMSNRDTNFIGGNNDINQSEVQRGNFASRFSWLAGYTGYVYILVGDVNPPRSSEAAGRTYSLQCTIGLPNTPTPTVDPRGTATPRPPIVPSTPEPPEPTMTPFPTPRSAQNLVVRPLDASQLRPTRAPQPTPRVITLDVQVFNDLNRNGLLDTGEGVANTSVRIADENGGAPLSQAYTDAEGRVRFSISNDAPVRVTIPLFGYSTVVNDANSAVRLALVPNFELPSRLP